MSSSRKFLLGLMGLLPAYGLLMALAFLVDPRGTVSAVFPSAGGACPPGIRLIRRASIPFIAPARQPREILLGTSRVAFGFAQADAERLLQRPVANLALETASFDEVATLVRQAWAGGSVKRVWIGLDYTMFLDMRPVPLATYRSIGQVPSVLAYGLMDPVVIRYALGHFLRNRGHCKAPFASVLGFADQSTMAPMATDEQRFATQLAFWRSRPVVSTTVATRIAALERLVSEGQARGVRIILFTAPLHRQMHQAMVEAKPGDLHERWLSAVRGVVARHAAEVRLIELGDVALPEQQDGRPCATAGPATCLFYDAIHYRPPLGRRILEIGTETESRQLPDQK